MTPRGQAEVWRLLAVVLLTSLAAQAGQGQTDPQPGKSSARTDLLTIVNPKRRDIPADRAKVLLLTTFRVVAEEFHRKADDVQFPLTLVAGEPNEHYSIDQGGGITVYLDRWNETKFVESVITGAVQRLTPPHLRKQMLMEIIRRSDRNAPVSANELRTPANVLPPRPALGSDCVSAVNDTPCPWPNRPPY